MKLPQPEWLATPQGARLADAIGCNDDLSRLVGGTVRDGLLGADHADIDFATRLAPADVIARLEAAGIKAVPTGIAHGTVTAVSGGLVAEITTLRRDVSTDGRRATVAFTDDWREDAARRDFTINALYARLPSGEIDDYFGGLDDLAAGRVRFIGEPLARIAEDHLRILRFFRFHGRFATGEPDAGALTACRDRANDLMALSRERIRDELFRILILPNAVPTIRLMLANGILFPVIPEIRSEAPASLDGLARREAAAGVPGSPLRRLAALLPADRDLLTEMGARLRLSRRDADRLAALAERYPALPAQPFADAYRSGREVTIDRLLLLDADASALIAFLGEWQRPPLPISGKDIIARGVPPGPAVSKAVQAFEQAWVDAGFPNDAAAIDRLIASVL